MSIVIQVVLLSHRGLAMLRVCHQLHYNSSTASSASDYLTLRTLFCSVFVVVVHAAINIDSLMRRCRCTADCRSCCSQVQHVIDRQPSQLSLTIPICAFHIYLHSTPPLEVPVGLFPWRLMRKNQNVWLSDAEKIYRSILYRFSVV